MADFRRWLYALALVALIMGITVPASAQLATAFTCQVTANPTNARAEGYTEEVGDVVIYCNGGQPTSAGNAVPQASVTVQLNTNITSKLTTSSGWDEALLLIGEPNSPSNPNVPILNCGYGGNDTGPSGPGVCSIISDGNPLDTYAGVPNRQGVIGGFVGEQVACTASTYGCGFPNVFQGHTGTAQNAGQANSVVFSGVPFDPPGTTFTRTIRITNVRSDAESLGVSTTLTLASVTMSINVQPSTTLPLGAGGNAVVVASVYRGLIFSAARTRLDFTQCNSENSKLFAGTLSGGIPYFGECSSSSSSSSSTVTVLPGTSGSGISSVPSCYGGVNGGAGNGLETADNGDYVLSTPTIRFSEGFNTAFKARNIGALTQEPVAVEEAGAGGWEYGTNPYPPAINPGYPEIVQNVPGAVYSTEDGFVNCSSSTCNYYFTNPPQGISSTQVPISSSTDYPVADNTGGGTGIQVAGMATQGTRLIATFGAVPNGTQIYVPVVTFLYRQSDGAYGGSTPADPTKYYAGHSTGVAILVTTDAAGNSNLLASISTPSETSPLYQVPVTAGAGYVTYEVLFDDPSSLENVDVPVVVAYTANLTANAPVGLPVPGTPATVTGGFAPFYASVDGTASQARLPQLTSVSYGSLPRFIPGTVTANLFEVGKCACNLLFPYVTNTLGYDTGIAIANTSQDPGGGTPNTNDFGSAQPQSGAVTIWYYGQGANNTAAPSSQVSSVISAGQLLLYALSSGNASQNLDNRAAGFEGYIITQAAFEYCHGFAFIEAQGGGPSNPATGYLGIVLDGPGYCSIGGASCLPRTNSPGENDAH